MTAAIADCGDAPISSGRSEVGLAKELRADCTCRCRCCCAGDSTANGDEANMAAVSAENAWPLSSAAPMCGRKGVYEKLFGQGSGSPAGRGRGRGAVELLSLEAPLMLAEPQPPPLLLLLAGLRSSCSCSGRCCSIASSTIAFVLFKLMLCIGDVRFDR